MKAKPFLVVVLLALLIRFGLSLLLDWQTDLAKGDAAYYLSGSMDGFRAPGYSAFVWLFGRLTLPLQAVMGVVGGLAVWIALEDENPRLAALSGAAVALSPLPVPIELRFLSETLYGFLVLVSALCLYRERPIIAGLTMGLALLTRDSLLLLPLFFLPFVPWRRSLAFATAAYIVAAPWYLTHSGDGRGGFALWVGTWERSVWSMGNDPLPADTPPDLVAAYKRKDFRPFKYAAMERIKSDPAFVAQSWIERYPRLWLSTRSELIGTPHWSLPIKAVGFALNLAVLLLGLAGMLLTEERHRLLAAPVLYAAVAYVPFHNSEPRYALFALPFLVIFAMEAVLRLPTIREKSVQ